MIGYLKGQVIDISADSATIEAGGVGYEITASLGTLGELSLHSTAELWIHTHVREDALSLFGFLTKSERSLFLSLLKVNGIGPKSAINILSGASFDRLCAMIEGEDVKALSGLPKVGKKTAEQMILTLKGKLVHDETAPAGKTKLAATPRHREISSALINLGFRPQDVETVVSGFQKDIELQDGIRQGLAALTAI